MNTYIITYTDTDGLYRGIYKGQKFSVTANTAREAIIAFYKKNIAFLCVSASNGCIYNQYGKVVQTGDDWIQYGKGRFTAKLADDQPKETPVEAEIPVQSPMERLLKDATNGQQMMQDSAHFHHSVYRILAGDKPIQVIESLCEAIMAQNEQIKRMAEQSKFGSGLVMPRPHEVNQEIERLKADKEAFERLSEKAKQAYSDLQGKRLDESIAYNKEYQRLQDEVDRLKADNARLKQQSEKMQTEMLELLKDLHKMDNMSRLIHDTKPTNHNG